MKPTIKSIELPLPLRMGRVNCYLVDTGADCILFDTGGANNRDRLVKELEDAGCSPGRLALIILTHGDFDHCANAAFLSRLYGASIAMHVSDAGMVEHGDMFSNRRKPNPLFRLIAPLAFRLGRSDRFTPDILLEDGDTLDAFGLEADVLHIPGHSLGSIGILLRDGHALIGGDLLDNVKSPGLNALMDDVTAAAASLDRLERRKVGTVYPGHGRPFPMEQFLRTYRQHLT